VSNEVENLKLSVGASKPPVGIVPMHPLLGVARVLEDSAIKYAPFNYMAQGLADALEAYDSAELRHRIEETLLGGQVTPESYAAPDADSGIPHIYHRIADLMILASLMIRDGVIAADPGQGKRKVASTRLPPKLAQRSIEENMVLLAQHRTIATTSDSPDAQYSAAVVVDSDGQVVKDRYGLFTPDTSPVQLELPLDVSVDDFDNQPTQVFETQKCEVEGCGCTKTFPADRDPAAGADW
jgi:hypothetical protein